MRPQRMLSLLLANLSSTRGIPSPNHSSLCRGRSVAQLVSLGDVYVLDFCEEVRVSVLIRWLFRLVLFRVLVGLWRIVWRR
jgi:hypothetical protein